MNMSTNSALVVIKFFLRTSYSYTICDSTEIDSYTGACVIIVATVIAKGSFWPFVALLRFITISLAIKLDANWYSFNDLAR